ncbi:jg11269 [Pararge aegeria aegeria]|uniref:Jg11269 protein n=1 Tax=Pararge aegeria aegeria TaxID=348720 RepID=A0A8S4RL77_9NEOP|nr:jg11269 [Pararge aegeria aegeria]
MFLMPLRTRSSLSVTSHAQSLPPDQTIENSEITNSQIVPAGDRTRDLLLKITRSPLRLGVQIGSELNRQSTSILERIRILKFFGHITRNKHSMERLVVQGKVEGKRSRGRSPTRWTDIIKATTQTSIVQCSRNAEDRNKWRRIAGAAVAKENEPSSTTTTLSRVND